VCGEQNPHPHCGKLVGKFSGIDEARPCVFRLEETVSCPVGIGYGCIVVLNGRIDAG